MYVKSIIDNNENVPGVLYSTTNCLINITYVTYSNHVFEHRQKKKLILTIFRLFFVCMNELFTKNVISVDFLYNEISTFTPICKLKHRKSLKDKFFLYADTFLCRLYPTSTILKMFQSSLFSCISTYRKKNLSNLW